MSSSRNLVLRPLRRMSSIQAFLTKSLRSARARKSTQPSTHSAPILRLPCELLIYVLELVQELEGLSHYRQARTRLLRLSFVCSAWRIAILESPSFWRLVEFKILPWTKLMLERSANLSSIDIICPSSTRNVLAPVHDEMEHIRLLLDNVHRTRHLSLFGLAAMLLLRHADASHALPLLETLILRASDSWIYWVNEFSDHLFTAADQLRSLEIDNIAIPSSSSLFRPDLTKLSLRRKSPYPGCTLTEMTSLLQGMTSLVELSVNSWIKDYSYDDDITNLQSTIILPQLQSLKFTCDTLIECARFVHCLCLPQTTCLQLRCISDPLGEAILPLSYLPQQSLNGLSPLPLMIFKIFYLGTRVKIHGSPAAADVDCDAPGAFKLDVRMLSTYHDISEVGITHILGPLRLLSVTSLALYSGSASIDWSQTLAMLQSVEEINILGCQWNIFVRSLSAAMPGQAEHAMGQIVQMPCPCLRRLEFTHSCDQGCCETLDPLFLESLAIVLDMRRTGGVPVEKVVIQGEHLSPTELRSFKMTKYRKIYSSARS